MPHTKLFHLDRPLSRKKALDWALVLHAMGIPYRILRDDMRYRISVPDAFRTVAEKQIRLYERETLSLNRLRGVALPAVGPGARVNWILLFAFPVLFYIFQIYRLTVSDVAWTDAGYASADKILKGEWWRAVTGLFLHANEAHFAANIVLGTVIAYFLSAITGEGLAWLLILVSGIAGTVLNAALYQTGHDFIGFSTAVFGGIGLLTGLELARLLMDGKKRRDWRRIVIPLGGGLALFGLFGTGAGTDISAHLAGLVCGVLTGAVAGIIFRKTGMPGKIWQIAFLGGSVMTTAVSWMAAFLSR